MIVHSDDDYTIDSNGNEIPSRWQRIHRATVDALRLPRPIAERSPEAASLIEEQRHVERRRPQ